ncbi:MAG: transposase [Candidatus Peribacteraceae bacterium]|nr:transposase [Candidatus Peribacteraceae bacterium]MDD5739172.1 transposase [Candidatus Peribacteraceae bacterium]
MTQRHPIQNGQMMLVTTNTCNRMRIFVDSACARQVIESLYRAQLHHPFFLHGFVVMPDHCHILLHIPENGSISKIMYCFKRSVCFEVGKPIWQRRFHVRLVDNAWEALRYIHLNPVRQGICEAPADYPWSSASGRWDVTDLSEW